MKKFFVSTIVIVSFVVYSMYNHSSGQSIPLLSPKAQTPTDFSQSLPTDTPPPSATPTNTPEPTQPPSSKVTPTSTPIPTNTSTPTPKPNSPYKDGAFTGDPADAFYGLIQVQIVISNGKMSNIKFLQYPNDRDTSRAINSQADPMLAQEAIQAQSAHVDIISGATDSSNAFVQSLQSALDKAKN